MNLERYGDINAPINLNVKKENISTTYFRYYDKHLEHLTGDAKILDIGPGNGVFDMYILKKKNLSFSNFELVDISESVVNNLQKNPMTKNFTVHLVDSIQRIKDKKETYDLIVMKHVLEHMEKKYINELIPLLVQSLKKGGKIIIEVPNMGNSLGRYVYFADYSHMTPFTDKSLTEAFLWNTPQDIEIKMYAVSPSIDVKQGVHNIIKEIILKLIRGCLMISSFFTMRAFGRFSSKIIYSHYLLAVITKK